MIDRRGSKTASENENIKFIVGNTIFLYIKQLSATSSSWIQDLSQTNIKNLLIM